MIAPSPMDDMVTLMGMVGFEGVKMRVMLDNGNWVGSFCWGGGDRATLFVTRGVNPCGGADHGVEHRPSRGMAPNRKSREEKWDGTEVA
jgi:hypothetical protein